MGFDNGGRGGHSGGNRSHGGGHRDGGYGQQDRKMHKTTCAECKQECEVPFKPTEGRDVFCKDCFRKRRDY
jgi:CxxC-x17-CxxC domain-containing protein